jgi:hypothetical protein
MRIWLRRRDGDINPTEAKRALGKIDARETVNNIGKYRSRIKVAFSTYVDLSGHMNDFLRGRLSMPCRKVAIT